MKAMEEEVLIKNGEIKILRDSLHQTESVLEEQRRSHFLLEQEKAQALSDREKEFSRKVTPLLGARDGPSWAAPGVPLEAAAGVAGNLPEDVGSSVLSLLTAAGERGSFSSGSARRGRAWVPSLLW